MCISPKSLVVNGERIQVSCGKCYECIRTRKREWLQRILSEVSVSDVCFFSLISYNDENYPSPDVADKVAIQKFIKRLRVALERNFSNGSGFKPKLKYFIVSEYGEERNRLHYHALFFLRHVDETVLPRQIWKELLEKEWGKGFCSAFYLEPKTAKYCVKYIQKQYNLMFYSRIGGDSYAFSQLGVKYKDNELPVFPINGKPFLAPRSMRIRALEQNFGSNAEMINSIRSRILSQNPSSNVLSYEDKKLINDKHVADNADLFIPKEDIPKLDNSVFSFDLDDFIKIKK